MLRLRGVQGIWALTSPPSMQWDTEGPSPTARICSKGRHRVTHTHNNFASLLAASRGSLSIKANRRLSQFEDLLQWQEEHTHTHEEESVCPHHVLVEGGLSLAASHREDGGGRQRAEVPKGERGATAAQLQRDSQSKSISKR